MRKQMIPLLLSLFSGVLFGSAFVNSDLAWISLFCLVPLFLGIRQASNLKVAALLGTLAGITAVMIATWPLTSAATWTGWQTFATEQISSVNAHQSQLLLIIWIVYGIGGGLFWGVFALLEKCLSRNLSPWLILLLLPSLWVVIVDWLLRYASFGYLWMPMGAMLGGFPWLEQGAAIGGVLFLSVIVVLVNSSIYIAIAYRRTPNVWLIPLTIIVLVCMLGAAGFVRMNNLRKEAGNLGVAAIQFHKPTDYTLGDCTDFFMDRHYLRFSRQAYRRFPERFELLVLPETVGFGAIALDNLRSSEKVLSTIDQWTRAFKPMVNDHSLYILGMDTSGRGAIHNSMLVWNSEGLLGVYHKRRLVPFAEFQPDFLKGLTAKSKYSYAPGHGAQIIETGKWKLGCFICQEVLFPELTRASVRAGANILISSGNDGVFSNPTVAGINANAARLRAIETGRYIVRAMKSGISAIISPDGQLVTYAEIGLDKVLVNLICISNRVTFYVRHGDWVIGLLSLVLGGIILTRVCK